MSDAYDDVPYRSHPYAHAHPDHLAAVATLLGLDPVPVDGARVLEIGCSTGGHLLPLAAALPGATFVGIDPARTAVDRARETIRALKLGNVEVLPIGIEQLADGEPFDYVVAHGVLSWIPPEARAGMWRWLSTGLSARGVAYLSYNTHPGWSQRGALCRAMRWHVRHLTEPAARVAGARELVAVLCESVPPTGEWGVFLHAERRRLDTLEDWYLIHDHLAEHNHPLWFHEVAATAEAHDLRFLCEAEPWRSLGDRLPSPAHERLVVPAADVTEAEQLRDLVRQQVFRESLFVRGAARATRPPTPDRLRSLWFTLRARPEPGPDPVRYRTPEGTTLTAHDDASRRLLRAFGGGDRPCSFDELVSRSGGSPDEVGAALLPLALANGALRLHRWPRRWLDAVTARPVVFAPARLQAAAGEARVTNLAHDAVAVDAFDRGVLRHLDGAHDRERLTAVLRAAAERGELALDPSREILRADPWSAAVERRLPLTLSKLARSALLVA